MKEKVFHSRNKDKNGCYKTVTGVTTVLLEDSVNKKWALGVAACDKRDSFCRKKGYQIAKNRALAALQNNKNVALPRKLSQENFNLLCHSIARYGTDYSFMIFCILLEKFYFLSKKLNS